MNEPITLILETANSSNVLRRVSGVLSRKGHNIRSFHSDPAGAVGRSMMEIVVECGADEADYMLRQLRRLYDVYRAEMRKETFV